MADFNYRAIDAKGHQVNGIMSADSEQALEIRVNDIGYWLIESSEHTGDKNAVNKAKKNKFSDKKVPRKELIDFFNGLHSMLAAGIPISAAIMAIAQETPDENFSQVLRDLQVNIEAGNTLDQTMTKHPKVFSRQITHLIKAGEYSGNLTTSCEDICDHLEWQEEIMADIKQASIYPIMIASAVLGLIFLMFYFVVPRFSMIFESLNLELPLLTRVVVRIGEFTTEHWWLILLCPVVIVLLFKKGPTHIPGFGLFKDKLILNLPIFGKLNRLIVQSRFCHNLGLLLKAGVPILEALKLCHGLVGNRLMALAIKEAEMSVNEGKQMTEGLRKHHIISPIVLRMIVVGEETGRLDNSLKYVSLRFDKEIPRQIKRVFSVLEPIIMVTMIIIVGLIGGAVFLPMFSLMSGIGGAR